MLDKVLAGPHIRNFRKTWKAQTVRFPQVETLRSRAQQAQADGTARFEEANGQRAACELKVQALEHEHAECNRCAR